MNSAYGYRFFILSIMCSLLKGYADNLNNCTGEGQFNSCAGIMTPELLNSD